MHKNYHVYLENKNKQKNSLDFKPNCWGPMLQQHLSATCFVSYQNLATNSVTPPQKQHEIFATAPTTKNKKLFAGRITFSPLKIDKRQQITKNTRQNENVALHSRPKFEQKQQEQTLYWQPKKATTTAVKTLTLNQRNGPNAQTKNLNATGGESSPDFQAPWENIENMKYNSFNLLKMKAQILKQNPSQISNEMWRQQNLGNMLQQHFMPQTPTPLKQPIIDLIPKPKKESLDFNSRRRRGRLRLATSDVELEEEATLKTTAKTITTSSYATTTNEAKAETEPKIETDIDYDTVLKASSISKANCRSLTAARSDVPATFVRVNNVAKQVTALLLTLLLSFLSITFVNKKPQENLVLSSNNILKTNRKRDAKTTHRRTSSSSSSGAALFCKSNIFSSSSSSSSSSKIPIMLSSPLSSTISVAGSSRLLYAYLFISILLIIPSHDHNMVSAAKPKSATQLQQQQQQHDLNQQQQHHHKPNIAYAAGADNVHIDKEGMVLTPPSYQGVSSQTSNEDGIDYLTDSGEQLFDDEKQNLNIVEEEEEMDRDSYEKDGNGKWND